MGGYLLAVNFHYVGMPAFPHPGIIGLSEAEFADIVGDLAARFEFATVAMLERWIDEGRIPDGRWCAITFDDGLACQAHAAAPILDRLKVPAIFFVAGQPLATGRALTVHKLHWSRAHLSHDEAVELVGAAYERVAGKRMDLASLDADTVQRHLVHDLLETGRLKYFMNYCMDEATNAAVVEQVFRALGEDEGGFVRRFYMTREDLRALRAGGHDIGAHGFSHRPLARLGEAEARAEFRRVRDVLQGALGAPVAAFSYPHGGADAVSEREARLAAEHGFRCGFTMERAVNVTPRQPLLLARIDAIEAPRGRKPLYDLDAGALPAPLRAGASVLRRRYFLESDAS